MRNIWKGVISFGLVSIPVKLYTATEAKDIKFNFLHKECKSPIKYEKVCPVCKKEVKPEELVRGYEYEKGRYVIVQEEDLEKIPLSTLKSIEILDFVQLEEVDPVYYVKTYYVTPGDLGTKPYHLLLEAMRKTGRIAMARIVLRQKESLAVLRVYKNCLAMETIYYPDEIRNTEYLPELKDEFNIHENELKMAVNLIDNLTAKFDPGKYKNQYREALSELIQAKISGEEVATAPQFEPTKVIDLMEALRASIEATQKEKKGEEKVKRRAARKKEA